MLQCAAYTACKGNSDNSEKSPKHRKKQADLPEKVKGLVAVIPYAFFKNNIKNKTEYEFNDRYRYASEQAFEKKPSFAAFGYFRKGQKAKPARYHHAPVGMPPP